MRLNLRRKVRRAFSGEGEIFLRAPKPRTLRGGFCLSGAFLPILRPMLRRCPPEVPAASDSGCDAAGGGGGERLKFPSQPVWRGEVKIFFARPAVWGRLALWRQFAVQVRASQHFARPVVWGILSAVFFTETFGEFAMGCTRFLRSKSFFMFLYSTDFQRVFCGMFCAFSEPAICTGDSCRRFFGRGGLGVWAQKSRRTPKALPAEKIAVF